MDAQNTTSFIASIPFYFLASFVARNAIEYARGNQECCDEFPSILSLSFPQHMKTTLPLATREREKESHGKRDRWKSSRERGREKPPRDSSFLPLSIVVGCPGKTSKPLSLSYFPSSCGFGLSSSTKISRMRRLLLISVLFLVFLAEVGTGKRSRGFLASESVSDAIICLISTNH